MVKCKFFCEQQWSGGHRGPVPWREPCWWDGWVLGPPTGSAPWHCRVGEEGCWRLAGRKEAKWRQAGPKREPLVVVGGVPSGGSESAAAPGSIRADWAETQPACQCPSLRLLQWSISPTPPSPLPQKGLPRNFCVVTGRVGAGISSLVRVPLRPEASSPYRLPGTGTQSVGRPPWS